MRRVEACLVFGVSACIAGCSGGTVSRTSSGLVLACRCDPQTTKVGESTTLRETIVNRGNTPVVLDILFLEREATRIGIPYPERGTDEFKVLTVAGVRYALRSDAVPLVGYGDTLTGFEDHNATTTYGQMVPAHGELAMHFPTTFTAAKPGLYRIRVSYGVRSPDAQYDGPSERTLEGDCLIAVAPIADTL